MPMLIKMFGMFMAIAGIVFILSPKVIKKFIAFLKEGKKLYAVGICRFLVGVILLLAAPQCRWNWFIAILGILIIIGSIFIFTLGLDKTKSMLTLWEKKLDTLMPAVGLIPVILGVLIIFAV